MPYPLPATAVPWWRTGWVALPIFAIAAGAGVGVAILREEIIGRTPKPPLCPDTIGPEGGSIADVEYLEWRSHDAAPDETLPMLVLFHGSPSRPTTIIDAVAALPLKVRVIAPMGFVPLGEQRLWWTPGDDFVTQLEDAAAPLETFVEEIQRCRPTFGRPLLAGYDEGASLAYALAAEMPGQIAGAVGAAGALPAELGPLTVPTHVVHGRADTQVPYEDTAAAVMARVAQGDPVKLLPMAGVDHSFSGALRLKWLEQILELLPHPPSVQIPVTPPVRPLAPL